MADKRVVLIALLGTSPAVLTETVWALATRKHDPVVPERIELWTTKVGKERFEKDVLCSGVWEQLKADLVKAGVKKAASMTIGEASFATFSNDKCEFMPDLLSEEDNLAAADKMLEALRKYTDNPNERVFLSIAGGRKTMGALALQCISLVGRAWDEVYHVLVNPCFENRLDPPFVYPKRRGKAWAKRRFEKEGSTQTISDGEAQVLLFNVPYVRMRPIYEEKMDEMPVTYRRLCERIQAKLNRKPVLKVSEEKGKVWLDGKEIKLSAAEFYTLLLILRGTAYKAEVLYEELKALKERFAKISFSGRLYPIQEQFSKCQKLEIKKVSEEFKTVSAELSKILSGCRKKGIPEYVLPVRWETPDLTRIDIKGV